MKSVSILRDSVGKEIMEQLLLPLLTTLLLGAFIGLQFRKTAEEGEYEDRAFAGLRTCMALTLLGFTGAILAEYNGALLILVAAFVLSLILLSYAQSSFKEGRIGGTSEILLGLLFFVGVLNGYEQTELAITLTILLSVIASARSEIYQIGDRFSRLEIIDTLKFAIIIFLILPLLPNEAIDPWGAINPYSIWLMVILISGIGFVGYMASKFIGKNRSILLTGLVGGTVSSTAVTTTMAIENKKRPKLLNIYTVAILLANLTMFVRVLIEVFIFNPNILGQILIPIGAMLISMLSFTLYFYIKGNQHKTAPKLKKEVELETPFSLVPALKFSAFFVVILVLIRVAEQYLGDQGVYLTSIVSGLADVDAIAISLSQLSATQAIDSSLAIRAITFGVISNTFIKIIYIHLVGRSEMTKKMLLVFLTTGIVGVITSFLI